MDSIHLKNPFSWPLERDTRSKKEIRRGKAVVAVFYILLYPLITQAVMHGYEYLGMTDWLPMVGITTAFVLYCGWEYAFLLIPVRMVLIYLNLGQTMDFSLNLLIVSATAVVYALIGYFVDSWFRKMNRIWNLRRLFQMIMLGVVGLLLVSGVVFYFLERLGYHFYHSTFTLMVHALIGGVSGILHITPFLVSTVFQALDLLFTKPDRLRMRFKESLRLASERRFAVLLELIAGILILGAALQPELSSSLFGDHGLIYFTFLPVIWVSLNYSIHIAISTVFLIDTLIILCAAGADFTFFGPYELQILVITLSLVGYILSVVMNDQRQLVRLLEGEEDKYRSVVRQTIDGIVLIDMEGIILEWNTGMEVITGRQGAEVVGSPILDVFPGLPPECAGEDSSNGFLNEGTDLHRDVDENKSFRMSLPGINGSIHEVDVKSSLVRARSGHYQVLVLRDSTEELQVQRALAASEERFRCTVERAHDGIVLIDEDGVVVEWNRGVERIFAISREDAVGKNVPSLMEETQIFRAEGEPLDLLGFDLHSFIRAARDEPVSDEIFQVVSADQSRHHVLCNMFSVSTRVRDILCIIASDVTGLIEREIDLRTLNSIMAVVTQPQDFPDLVELFKEELSMHPYLTGGLLKMQDPAGDGDEKELCWGLDQETQARISSVPALSWDVLEHQVGAAVLDLKEIDGMGTSLSGANKLVTIPLRSGERFFGYVAAIAAVGSNEPGKILFLNSIGHQVGTALQNAFLVGELRKSRERLRQLTGQIVRAQETERRRVARELHDEAGQALTALKIGLELLQAEVDLNLDSSRERLDEAVELADSTMEHIRLLARDLRPPELEALGLSRTLENICVEFERRTGLVTQFTGKVAEPVGDEIAISLYRFLQEALTNVIRHAYATSVSVNLCKKNDRIILEVEDDGSGFDVHAALDHSGGLEKMGLAGMGERLELIGGKLWITSCPARGTSITAEVPWRTV